MKLLERGATWIGVAALLLILVLVPTDAFMRYGLSKSVRGAYELITALLMVSIVFLPLAASIRDGDHPRVLLFQQRMSPRAQGYMDRAAIFVSLILLVILSYATFLRTIDSIERQEVSPTGLGIPAYYGYGIILLGCAIATLTLAAMLATAANLGGSEPPDDGAI